ncbi:unnamed protein product, partial [Symbiodinium sp. CCMP2456]
MTRSQLVAVWDKAGQRVWLHGGNDGFMKQDPWRYDSSANSWDLVRDIVQSGPSARVSCCCLACESPGLVHLRRLQRDPLRRPFGISGDHYLDYTLQDKFFNNLDLQLHHHKLQLHSLPDKYFTHTVVKYHRKHQLKQPFHQHQHEFHFNIKNSRAGSSWVLWIFASFVAVFVLPVSIVSFRYHLYREVVVPVTIQERLPFKAPQPVDPPRLCVTSWVLLTLPVLSITSPPPPVAVHSGAARISIRLRSDM